MIYTLIEDAYRAREHTHITKDLCISQVWAEKHRLIVGLLSKEWDRSRYIEKTVLDNQITEDKYKQRNKQWIGEIEEKSDKMVIAICEKCLIWMVVEYLIQKLNTFYLRFL